MSTKPRYRVWVESDEFGADEFGWQADLREAQCIAVRLLRTVSRTKDNIDRRVTIEVAFEGGE